MVSNFSPEIFYDKRLVGLNNAAIIAATDKHGTITLVNKLFEEITGYSKDELIGQNHRILKSGKHPPEFYKELWSTISAGRVWRGRICNRKKNGELYWVHSTIVPIFDDDGNIQEHFAVRFEITKEVQLEEADKLLQVKNIFDSQRNNLSRIAGGIGHEVYNPLSVVQALLFRNLALLDKEELDRNKIRDNFIKMQTHVSRIVKVIEGMKSVAEDGQAQDKAFHNLRKIVESALDFYRELLMQRNIEVVVDVVEVQVFCQFTQIQQVLINLISNSLDAISKLSEPRWIAIKTEETNELSVVLSITDSGAGIESQLSEKIMDPFFTTKPAGNGIGLGLTIAQNLMTANKGMIYLNKSCSNTQFLLELPLTE